MKLTKSFLLRSIISSVTLTALASQPAFAEIINPAVNELGNNPDEAKSGGLFVGYFLTIWNAIITVGALAVLVYFLWGAIEWITSAGDAGKLTSARNRMLHAFIGLVLLVTAYTIIGFISVLLFDGEFNILRPTFWAAN